MQTLKIGDVTITSIIERDGPWRRPEDMFPAYDPELGKKHLAALDPFVFDVGSGRMVITYQTFVVRTPKRTCICSLLQELSYPVRQGDRAPARECCPRICDGGSAVQYSRLAGIRQVGWPLRSSERMEANRPCGTQNHLSPWRIIR